jgi:hypothetical protein
MKFLALLLIGTPALAHSFAYDDSAHLPQSFQANQLKAVFADFKQANYEITYDVPAKKAYATATIQLATLETGNIVFDSAEEPTAVQLDGQAVSQKLVSTPSRETKVRVIQTQAAAGMHRLVITLPITRLVEFTSEGVKSAYWTTDLTDRGYLERYLPANYIFDRVQMNFKIHFIRAGAQTIYTNGVVTEIDAQNYSVEYPVYYNATSIFFHTVPANTFEEVRFDFKSIDGRAIPAVIYQAKGASTSIETQQANVTRYLNAMEAAMGPFLHPSLTGYVAGEGGMEYNGAFMASESAVNHELFHSYAARGVMPADGNAGWIDEALAVWWTSGMPALSSLQGSSQMAAHPYYTRTTDTDAYGFGMQFMALLNAALSTKGGLKPFLKNYFHTQMFTPYSTRDFSDAMNAYFSVDLDDLFLKYVYDTSKASFRETLNPRTNWRIEATPKLEHPQYSDEELQKLL